MKKKLNKERKKRKLKRKKFYIHGKYIKIITCSRDG